MARKNTSTPKTPGAAGSRPKAAGSRKSAPPAVTTETAPATDVVAPVMAPVPVAEAAAPRSIARDELAVMIRREAYQLAERRGFRNGNAFEDWITAETTVRARLAADGYALN